MKKIVVMLALVTSMLAPAALGSGVAYAADPQQNTDPFGSSNAKGQVCSGINGSSAAGSCTAPGKTVEDIVKTVLNLLSSFIGIIAVIMVIVSGFKYITAAGDSGKISSAKSTLMYALIGIVIVAMAQFITQFVLKQATNDTTSNTQKEMKNKGT